MKLLAVMLLLVLILLAYFKAKNQGKVLNNVYLEGLNISFIKYSDLKLRLEQVEVDDANISIIYGDNTN